MLKLEGMRFGRLLVVRRLPGGMWMCKCDCGRISQPITNNLVRGNTLSCGCRLEESRRTHGQTGSPEYRSWRAMRSRCLMESDGSYRNYGGRGIGIVPEWSDFENFLRDMGTKPNRQFDLDRIDNNKGYGPDNCRWVSRKRNLNNKRTNRIVEFRGRSQTITEWAEEVGIHPRTLHYRLTVGWSTERAFTEPPARRE